MSIENEDYRERVTWLRRYGDAVRKQRELAQKLFDTRASAVQVTSMLSSVRVQSQTRASACERAIERIEAARGKVQEQERVRKELYAEIFPVIAALPDAGERQVLCKRYIRCISMFEISEEMQISYATAKRIHRIAIAHLDMSHTKC